MAEKTISKVVVTRLRGRWQVVVPLRCRKEATVEIEAPHLDRGQIRGTVTVKVEGSIKLRDTVNLTSRRARASFLKNLRTKRISVDERVLIALDEACRTPGPTAESRECDGGRDFSDEVPRLTLTELIDVFARWLLIHDAAYLPILLGAILAHRFGGDPVWLLIVAPPGGTKTEPLRSLRGIPGFYALSELTPKTFVSGLEVPGGKDPSLLNRLQTEILVFKDFTTVLSMKRDKRSVILSHLREIHDGQFRRDFGTGVTKIWNGRVSIVAAVTPALDRHYSIFSTLGERFMQVRWHRTDEQAGEWAINQQGQGEEIRAALSRAVKGIFDASTNGVITLPPAMRTRVASLAEIVALARTHVGRNNYGNREIEYLPEAEANTRLSQGLAAIAKGIAALNRRNEVAEADLRDAFRVGMDCISDARRQLLIAIIRGQDVEQIAVPRTVRDRQLEELEALGLVEKDPTWKVTQRAGKLLDTARPI